MFVRSILLTLGLLMASAAYAHNCPNLMKQVDDQLAAATKLTAEVKAEVMELRKQGEALHKAGKHDESEEMLEDALELLEDS